MLQNKRLIRVNEAAEYLGYKPSTLTRMIKQGDINEVHGLGVWNGRIRFDKKKLDEFIENLTTNG